MVYMQEESLRKRGKMYTRKKKKGKGKKGTRDKKEKVTIADKKETKSQVGYSSTL